MAGWFPEGYPDEVFYSIIARFHRHTGYSSFKYTALDLFGSDVRIGLFPTHLQDFLDRLPSPYLTIEQLISDHTLMPFYTPFVSQERAQRLYDAIASRDKNRIATQGLLGTRTLNTTERPLMLCPDCVDEDRRTFGECYWHRTHQMFGVQVCPIHRASLVKTSAYPKTYGPRALRTAEQEANDLKREVLNPSSRDHQLLLNIAEDANWLLHNSKGPLGRDHLRSFYYHWLSARGYVNAAGFETVTLLEAVRDFWPQELLKLMALEVGLTKADNDWPIRTVRMSRGESVNPLAHLLMIQFAGCRVAQLFTPIPEPFGLGPWPCLNPPCHSHGKRVITQVAVTLKNDRPEGTFSCDCGFSYKRWGPDPAGLHEMHASEVLTYGPVWEAKLRELHGRRAGLSRVAALLGVSARTVIREGARLELEIKDWKTQVRPGSRAPADYESYRKQRRQAWLKLRTQHPNHGVTQLASIEPNVYRWLVRHDREWLEAHSPGPRRFRGDRLHWAERDQQLSNQVTTIAESLFAQPGKPAWVTRSKICEKLGVSLTALSAARAKLPRTMAAFEKWAEESWELDIRKIKWAVAELQQNKGAFTMRDLLWLAVVRNADHPAVAKLLEECIGSFGGSQIT